MHVQPDQVHFAGGKDMVAAFAPRSWLQLCIDMVILAYTTMFSLVSLSYCAAMWQLREEFFIALRYGAPVSDMPLRERDPSGKFRLTDRR